MMLRVQFCLFLAWLFIIIDLFYSIQVSFVSINGEGPFRFNISDMEIEAYGSLKRSGPDNSGLSIEEIQLDMNADEVQLNLENFEVLGSEVIAQTIISAMSDLIFGRVKNTIIEKASNKIKTLINKRLEKISLNKLLQNNSEVLFDDIVVTVAKRIKHRVDPVPLPPFRRSSSIKVLNMIPVNFSFEVKQGKLYGLTTFARMGDIYVIYEDESALIEAEVGFHNLTGKYHWQLNVLGMCIITFFFLIFAKFVLLFFFVPFQFQMNEINVF